VLPPESTDPTVSDKPGPAAMPATESLFETPTVGAEFVTVRVVMPTGTLIVAPKLVALETEAGNN